MRKSYAFTLIELLIVIGIISILALIAVPNFLEAQTRSKVSRVSSDMRSIATALETYVIDNNKYPDLGISYTPTDPQAKLGFRLAPITTPVAYITSLPKDVFNPGADDMSRNGNDFITYGERESHGAEVFRRLYAADAPNPDAVRWVLLSYGPAQNAADYPDYSDPYVGIPYDPTNGTRSVGCVKRVGP